jgi:outer membrane protein OmpA-like peptidoglycan-associated protein
MKLKYAGYNQGLSKLAAPLWRDYLVRNGIQPGTVGTAGFGESGATYILRGCRGRRMR